MLKPLQITLAAMLAIPFVFSTPSTSMGGLLKREVFPVCESEKVLKKLVKRFNQTEKIYWSERSEVLTDVINPHQHSENPFPESPINRRYCHGDAVFENGKTRRVHFLIEQGAGFAGFTWNVEYCVHGLDPWKYHDGRCRVLSR